MVIVLAAAALLALLLAVLTGSSTLAVLVIVLAVIGIVSLLRDWRVERTTAAPVITQVAESPEEPPAPESGFRADALSPDISTDPDGPSSDARAD